MCDGLLSIIIPIYNTEEYLDRCINSVVSQTYEHLEIICIDDGSTDRSGKIIEEWKNKDARIKVYHIENGGAANARNYGLKMAQGN